MPRSKKTSFLLSLVAVLASCGGDDGGAPAGADGGDDGGETDVGGCPASGEAIDLTGTWAARAWISVYMVTAGGGIVHLCPDRYYGVSRITLRVRVTEQTGTRIRHVFNVCRMEVPVVEAAVDPACGSSVRMQLAIGPALAALWPGIDYPGAVTLGGTTACSSYVADPLVAVFGTDDTIGAAEPLPTWRDGCTAGAEACVDGWAHVLDDDGDMHPGVTLTVASDPEALIVGEAYTAYRTIDLLRGEVWSSALVLGAVEPQMDYRILDSDVLVGGGPLAPQLVKDNIPVFDIPAAGSTFALVRADGRHGAADLDADGSGEVTCDEILAAEAVFTPYQP